MYFLAMCVVSLAMASALDWGRIINRFDSQVFKIIDFDQDGKITVDEAAEYFRTYDDNRNGIITLREFTEHIDVIDGLLQGNELVLFTLFDRNNDKEITDSDIIQTFRVGDTNGDGLLTFPEINRIVTFATNTVARARKLQYRR